MSARANGHGERRPTHQAAVSHYMEPEDAVALLRARHGDAGARSIALKELQRAKRARSKRRFVFWGDVATQIECDHLTGTES